MTDFIYEMPCLSKYRFNDKGECMHVGGGRIVSLIVRGNKTPVYRIYDDKMKEQYLKITEVIQYIKHLKSLTPILFGHYVVYRPIVIRSKSEIKFTVRKDTVKL